MRGKNWTTLLFVLYTLAACGQSKFDKTKISKETNRIVNQIEKVNVVMSSAVGYSGTRPAQYDHFVKLKGNATADELRELTNHPNPTVRCYSFWALTYDPSVDLYPIVLNHLNDNQIVRTQFGCIGGEEAVGDFFIDLASPDYGDGNSNTLNADQFARLDSILIYTSSSLRARSAAISRAMPTENLYRRIRELVISNSDQTALVALAKYKKEQDVELILANRDKGSSDENGFFYTYRAISHFPHPAFLPLLETNLQKTLDNTHFTREWRELYRAIAVYKNNKAKELLRVPFSKVKHDNIRRYHINFVFDALKELKNPFYDDLLWKLWTEENRITPDVFNYLASADPAKAFELTKETLKDTDDLYRSNIGLGSDNLDGSENLTSAMLELCIKQDRELGLKLIGENIEVANVHLFPIFANAAAELRDKSFVEPLFERLEKEWNAHVYLRAVETLIAYGDADINQRILNTRTKNTNLNKDWGGDALDKLLSKHNIK